MLGGSCHQVYISEEGSVGERHRSGGGGGELRPHEDRVLRNTSGHRWKRWDRTEVRRAFVRTIWIDSILGWNGQQIQHCLEIKVKMKSFLFINLFDGGHFLVWWKLDLWDEEEIENGWEHDLGPVAILEMDLPFMCAWMSTWAQGVSCAISSSISALCMSGKSLCIKSSLHR